MDAPKFRTDIDIVFPKKPSEGFPSSPARAYARVSMIKVNIFNVNVVSN